MPRLRCFLLLSVTPLWACWGSGCGPTIHPSFDSPEPAARNSAIVQAADRRDPAAVPDLVRMLDSDDPATRLLAINALQRITGETYGYDYAAPELNRQAATARWQKHIRETMPEETAKSAGCTGVENVGSGIP